MSPTNSEIAASRRLRREQRTIANMIRIYCRHHHRPQELFCADCRAVYEYVLQRLERCKFGPDKPTCEQCPVHCYKRDMRQRISQIMRYSGPRMLWYHPIQAAWHLWDSRKVATCEHSEDGAA